MNERCRASGCRQIQRRVKGTRYLVRGTAYLLLRLSFDDLGRRPRSLPRLAERIPRPAERILDVRHPATSLRRVVVGRLAIVGAQARLRVTAADVVAEDDGVVVAAGAPALELSSANGVE